MNNPIQQIASNCKFRDFAKVFYLYSQFTAMEATIYQAMSDAISISKDDDKLESWLDVTGYYGEVEA
jgi:hypothetical protein